MCDMRWLALSPISASAYCKVDDFLSELVRFRYTPFFQVEHWKEAIIRVMASIPKVQFMPSNGLILRSGVCLIYEPINVESERFKY